MAEDWLTDVRRYAADADEAVVAAIVRYCGIALRTRDASLVSFGDAKETGRVRENYLRKKLALTDDDATLDGGIAAVGERMKADRTKNRVTVYYLLADHFGKLGLFGGAGSGAKAGAAAAVGGAAATGAAVAAQPFVAEPGRGRPAAAASGGPLPVARDHDGGRGFIGFALAAAGVVIALVLAVMVLGSLSAGRFASKAATADDLGPPDFSVNTQGVVIGDGAPAAPVPVTAAPATAAPQGAGVIAAERDARPMLTVYFDTGNAAVTPAFAGASQAVRDYLAAHPRTSAAISGYNDPSGNAAANAALSKRRAQSVQAALVAAGIEAGRTALVKPAETTTTGVTPDQARRVEVTVTGG